MRKIFWVTMLTGIMMLLSLNCYAASDIRVYVDNEQIRGDQPAIVDNGRTLVPLRDIFDALEVELRWDGGTQTIYGTRNGKEVVLRINDSQAYVNEIPINLDVPPKIINGRTLVPLRFISENFDADVTWNGVTRSVYIGSNLKRLFPAMLGGKYGFVDNNGEVAIDFKYKEATRFFGPMAFVKGDNGKYGCINKAGEIIHPFEYDYLSYVYDELDETKGFVVSKSGLKGLVNTSGVEVLPCQYADITLFTDGYAWAFKDISDSSKVDVINQQGVIINSKTYSYFGYNYQRGGLLRVTDERNRIGFVDISGKLVVPYKYTNSYGFYNGIADVAVGGLKAAMDSTGKLLTGYKYKDVTGLGEGLIEVLLSNNKYGLINLQGKAINQINYDFVCAFSDGLAQVSIGDKRGYIDPTGKLVIPCIYDDSGLKNDFKDGVVRVNKDGKTGFINKTGKALTAFEYDRYPGFKLQNGLSIVRQNDNAFGCVNTEGREVIPCLYEKIIIDNGYAIAKFNGLYGCLDREGNVVVPFIYENMK